MSRDPRHQLVDLFSVSAAQARRAVRPRVIVLVTVEDAGGNDAIWLDIAPGAPAAANDNWRRR